jgi:hypothetical protein
LASGNSDSDFAPDLSVTGLHIRDPGESHFIENLIRANLEILNLHI